VASCLAQLLPEPTLVAHGVPATARVTLTRQDTRRMVHVKLTHPESRTGLPVVDDYPTLLDASVDVRAGEGATQM
jgi:hypothetical protein